MHPGPPQPTSPVPPAAPARWRLRAAAPWGLLIAGVGLASLLDAWALAGVGLGLAGGLLFARRWQATAWRPGPAGDLGRLLQADPHTCLVDADGHRLHDPHGAPEADWLAQWGEDADRLRQALLEAVLGGQSQLRACRPAPDGGRTHWDIHLLRIEGGQGRAARLLVRMRDLQSEVDARVEAARARSQRDVLVDAIADACIELDAGGRVVRANPAAERLFERPAAGMLGRSLWEAIPGMESTALAAFLRSLDGRGGSDRTEVFHPPARRWLAVTAHAGPQGSLLFLADISARVEALEELRHKTARLELVQAVGRFGGWDYLPDEGALQLDDNALWLVGADASLPRSSHRQALMGALQPEARLRLIDALLACLNARSALEIELPLRPDSPTGASHVRLVGRWSDSGGRPLMLGALQDISAEQAQREELRAAGRFARAITEALPLDIRVIQADGTILSRNRAQGEWPADSQHPLAGEPGDDYLALCAAAAAAGCPDAQRIAEAIDDVARARRSEARLEWRPAAGDDAAGHEWFRCTVTPLSLRDRDRLVVAHEDISHQKRLEHAVHAQDERLREISRHMPDVLWTFDVDADRLLFISDNVEGMFGLPAAVFHADPYAWRRLVHPEDATAPQDAFARYSRGEATEWGYRLNHPDGSLRWIEERAYPVLDDQGRLLRVVGISADVTQRRLQEAALHRVSNFDALTGLPNRARFNELLADACHPGADRTALLLVNLDHFKRLNDVLGIRQGDELIRQSGERLLRLSGEGWLLARVGGDEFGALLPLGPERPTPAAEASRILAAFAEPFSIEGDPVFATVSIGFAEFGRDASDPEGLFTAADGALAVAKRSGRNRYAQYDPAWQQASARQLSLETELRGALDRRQFELFFQPKLDLRSGRLSGAEALLRWRHPERGLVSPADFIPLLEDSGLILPVGRWVLEAACAQRAAWQGLADADFVMAANLSVHQLQDEGLVEHMAGLLARYGLRGERIELEITESALMREPEQGLRLLQRLRALDLRIAVDDFGTGYSSLAYLHRFDPDTVKLDRSFVEPILGGEKTRKFVSGIIGLAHTLGQHVVAEGVESQAQLALLRQLGCDAIQGFAYGRPMPANEFGALFTQARASAAQGLAPAPDPCENPPPKRP